MEIIKQTFFVVSNFTIGSFFFFRRECQLSVRYAMFVVSTSDVCGNLLLSDTHHHLSQAEPIDALLYV